MKEQQINIGIIGLGTVGTGVARVLLQQGDLLKMRSNVSFNLKAIAELNWDKERNIDLSGIKCTQDVNEVLFDPDISVIVETIGGYEPAFSFISTALNNGKHVVTANKALIATKGKELFKIARENNVDLLFEASVGGGIPIIKSLRESLISNRIENIYGILNGTSNYILTKMYQEGLDFSEALKEAQHKGFAEADPTLDISGGDTAHKLTILASIAANSFVPHDKIYVEGITEITKQDINFVKSLGYTIKLLAIYRTLGDKLDLRVHPTLVNNTHLLSAVNNELNAIFVKGDFVGDTMFYGPGAGERPTASAIVGDIVDLSRYLFLQEDAKYCNREINLTNNIKMIPIAEVTNRFYLRFYTLDKPGVLSKISGVLGDHEISISSMVQLETLGKDNYIPIVLLTYEAMEKSVEHALNKITEFEFVKKNYLRLRLF